MFFNFTIPLLLTLAPVAGAVTVEEAAQLLSHFPAGQVPGEPTILEAIHTISEDGGPEDLPVLQSLALHESGPVRAAAIDGLGHFNFRQRTLVRQTFTGHLPSRANVGRWIADNAHALRRTNGDILGPTEQTSVAYAALILPAGDLEPNPSHTDLRKLAQTREDAADARGALRLYTEAMRRGDPAAIIRIRDYGVDVERLILGMLCAPRTSSLSDGEATLETLVSTGGTRTVRVMMERATRGSPLQRAIALDALSRMIDGGRLSASNARAARRSLIAATRWDPEMNVRTLARAALDELTTH